MMDAPTKHSATNTRRQRKGEGKEEGEEGEVVVVEEGLQYL
jgi:hypothetical protein